MKFIATDVTDSPVKMSQMVADQLTSPALALDPYFYRSHVIYQAELDSILYKSWLYAGHISQLPNKGDYFLFELGEDSVIISRNKDGAVLAMHNVCRHRGSRVCEDKSGNRKRFVCPYHGWVYNIDGSLFSARDMENIDDFSRDNFGLKKLRIEIFQGLIFINCDNDAADFQKSLGKIRIQLGAYNLENAKIAESKIYQVDANWKFCLENYLECYHCASSHKDYARLHTLKALPHKVKNINETMLARADEVTGIKGITKEVNEIYGKTKENGFGACVNHFRYALYENFKTGSKDGEPVAPLMGQIKGYDGGAADFQMGPLCFMLNYPDHCVLYRFTPRGLTLTDMELVWFVNDDAKEAVDYDKEKLTWLWHTTTLEDEYIISRNSEGANSKFFEPGPLHPVHEESLMEFLHWYLNVLKDY